MRFTQNPSIFTVEVDGQPVLAFKAANAREAAELLREAWFRDELRGLRSKGQPLWDGVTGLRSRRADEAETDRYQAMSNLVQEDADDDLFLAYLVALDNKLKPDA